MKPDVVTLDIEMPVLNGLEALKTIMQENPVPVIMLSSTTREGEENTVLALEYGAIDFVQKPSGAISLDLHKVKDELVRKVISASKANIKQVEKTSLIGTTETENHSKIELQNPIIHSKVSFGKWNYPKKS